MFNDLVESSVIRKKTHKSWAIILSTAVQFVILVVLMLIPLIYTQALPKAILATMITEPTPPPPPPPPAASVKPLKIIKPVARLIQNNVLIQPRAIPRQVTIFNEAELPPEITNGPAGLGVPGGIPGGTLDNPLGNSLGATLPAAPPKPLHRIRQGGQVTAASIIEKISPQYPPLARQARIAGDVVLRAIIDKDGRVSELQVISGHPLLVQAAMAAVRQWRFRPTILNGDPVEVDTTITVTFVLGGMQ